MTKTKSQKARAAAKKGRAMSNTTSSNQASGSAPKSRKVKSKKSKGLSGIPAVFPDFKPKYGMKGMDSITVEVSQWLTAVQTGVQGASKILYSFYLNPQSFLTAGRLSKLASLYEKFYFEHFEASYHPNVAVTNQGSVFLALDMDPEDSLTGQNGIQLMNSLTAMGSRHFQMGPVYAPLKVEAGGKSDFTQVLFVDPDRDGDRMAYAGRLIIGTVSAFASDLQAGFVTIKARIKFLVPALETSGAGSGSMNSWQISSPTHLIPWGTGTVPSSRNNIEVELRTSTPLGAGHSCLYFGQAGVFLITWYSTGSAFGSGTLTANAGASFITGGDSWNAGHTYVEAAQTATFGAWLVNVPSAGGYVEYDQAGTHSSSTAQYIRVVLTPYQLSNANPMAVMVSGLQEKLNSLSLEIFRMKSDRAYDGIRSKPAPFVPGETWETQTSSSSSSVLDTYNAQPSVITTSGTSSSATEQISLASQRVLGGIDSTSDQKVTIDSPALAVRDLGNVYNRLQQSYRDIPGDGASA